jgi:hypothetical protein
MAKAGDELVNSVTGLRTVFRKTTRDTDGELLQVDWIGEPGWTTGPDHVHPLQEERFEVISGKLGLRLEGVKRIYATSSGPRWPSRGWSSGHWPPLRDCSDTGQYTLTPTRGEARLPGRSRDPPAVLRATRAR